MDHSLLSMWLGLPAGPWPPDHYVLLEIEPGRFDPRSIEPRVLERMARLRPHQLLHPELVTEGMNRLAQALVCLTDPAARAAYDAEMGTAPLIPSTAKVIVPPPLPAATGEPAPGFPIPTEEETLPPDVTQVIEVEFAESPYPPEPLPPAYEIVEPPAYEIVETPAYEIVEEPVIEAAIVSRPAKLWQPATRRQLYSRLAAIRRLRAAWSLLQPALADPREPIDRPVLVLGLLEAQAAVRQSLGHCPGFATLHRPGGLVAALVRETLMLSTVRELLPDQRQRLTNDWHLAAEELAREYDRLRELARARRPFRLGIRPRTRLRRIARFVARNPESLLLVLAALLMAAAIVAGFTRRPAILFP